MGLIDRKFGVFQRGSSFGRSGDPQTFEIWERNGRFRLEGNTLLDYDIGHV